MLSINQQQFDFIYDNCSLTTKLRTLANNDFVVQLKSCTKKVITAGDCVLFITQRNK